MKINKYNALRFWEECYGSKQYAEDFHGNLMCKDGYGNNMLKAIFVHTVPYFFDSSMIACSERS